MAERSSKTKFGVPIADAAGILMPKLKFRFRVQFTGDFAGLSRTTQFTQNVMNVTRPKVNYEEV